ncbi:unnamed protein product [Pylaiella littoralis]
MSGNPDSTGNSTTSEPPAGALSAPQRIQRGLPGDGPPLRLRLSATVVKGFGRGSKLLGIPTANMDMEEIGERVHDTTTGIYYGYAMLKGVVYPAVISVGWNPYFDNKAKTVEPHLLHEFSEDFYGEKLHVLLCGFIRNELNFNSLDELVVAIADDIKFAKEIFEDPAVFALATDDSLWAEVSEREREAAVAAAAAAAVAESSS